MQITSSSTLPSKHAPVTSPVSAPVTAPTSSVPVTSSVSAPVTAPASAYFSQPTNEDNS